MSRFEVDIAEQPGAPCVVEAAHPHEAARRVIRQGKTPLAVRRHPTGWRARLQQPLGWIGGVDRVMLAVFAQQLAELLRAGVGLEQALRVLARQEGGGPMALLSERLLARVREGQSLSRALTGEEGVPAHVIGLIQGAEAAGRVCDGLAAAGQSLDREVEIARRVRAVLAYPLLLFSLALASTLFILLGVIPEFAPLFAGEVSRLPWATRLVLFASDLLVESGGRMAAGLAMMGVTVAVLLSERSRLREAWLARLASLPPQKYALRLDAAGAMALIGALLQQGLDASAALTHGAQGCRSRLMRDALAKGANLLREGACMSKVFSGLEMLPASIRLLVEVGEDTGQMGRAMSEAGRLLATDTERRIDRLLSILNPLAVILMGGVIAFLIAGLMLGILSVNQLALR